MITGYRLRGLNDLMKIRIHKFVNQINVLETCPMNRHHNILQSNHIVVPNMSKKLQLPQRSKRINAILKHVGDLLDRDFLIGFPIDGRANNSICPSTNGFDRHVLGVNLKQSLPYWEIMLPSLPNPIRRLNYSSHFTPIIHHKEHNQNLLNYQYNYFNKQRLAHHNQQELTLIKSLIMIANYAKTKQRANFIYIYIEIKKIKKKKKKEGSRINPYLPIVLRGCRSFAIAFFDGVAFLSLFFFSFSKR